MDFAVGVGAVVSVWVDRCCLAFVCLRIFCQGGFNGLSVLIC